MADTTLAQPLKQAKPAKRGKPNRLPGEKSLAASPGTWFVWAGIVAFFIFLFGIILIVTLIQWRLFGQTARSGA